MKKLIICIFATGIYLVSFAQLQKADSTVYFNHKHINFKKTISTIGSVIIENIDVKKSDDKDAKIDIGTKWMGDRQMKDGRIMFEKFQEDIHIQFFNYIEENFSETDKKELLNIAKTIENRCQLLNNPNRARILSLIIKIDRNARFEEILWFQYSEFQHIVQPYDVANMDILVRKNMVIEKSNFAPQNSFSFTVSIFCRRLIEYLEKQRYQKREI